MRFHLCCSHLVLAAGLAAWPASLAAQAAADSPDQAAATNGPETATADPATTGIIVTGFRSSNIASIETKRDDDRIVDAISQDEAGLLPDLDVTQIAQRIPGVSVISTFGADNDRSSDDSEAVVIRGLRPNFNLVTLDGVPIASADDKDRRTKTSIIPPSVISSVEALKTLTPDMDPHGLSGQLNMVTMSAFRRARSGPYASARVSLGLNDTRGQVAAEQGPDVRADGAFATLFGANREWGLVLAGSYSRFYSTNYEAKPGVQDDTYLFYRPNSNSRTTNIEESNGFPATRRNQIFAFEDDRERIAGIAKIEYQPDDATYASLYYGHFEETESENRWEYLALGNQNVRPQNQTATSGTWATGRVEYGFVAQPEATKVDLLTANFRRDLDDRQTLDAKASWSQARMHVTRNMSKFRPSNFNAEGAFSYDLSSGRPELTFLDPDGAADLSKYITDYIRERSFTIDQSVYHGRIDYAFNQGTHDRGFGFSAGGAFTRREQAFDEYYIEGDVFRTQGCTQSDVTRCPLDTMDRYVLSKVLPGPGVGVPFFLIDDAAFRREWEAQGKPITADRSSNSIQNDYELTEENYGAYFQASFRSDNFMLRGGVRYDRSTVDVAGFAQNAALPDEPDGAAQYQPNHRNSRYAYWLPSAIGRLNLTDNLVLRAGYGRTIGRPNFDDYARTESIGVPDSGNISISRGNPNLRPRQADNYDLSLEYYFDNGASLLSVAAFHKDVRDMIYVQRQTVEDFLFDGERLTAEISQPVNASKARISGIELSARKDFSNTLPAPFDGFIIQANATWLNGQIRVLNADGNERIVDAWESQPDFLANAQLSYEKGPFAANIAYNYVSEFMNRIDQTNPIFDIYRTARQEVDAQIRYDISDKLQFRLEVQNLTGENIENVRSFPFGDLTAQSTEKGRRFWFGMRWQM